MSDLAGLAERRAVRHLPVVFTEHQRLLRYGPEIIIGPRSGIKKLYHK